jgi:uncharacterized protein
MIETTDTILPWHRQFWFWFVFGPLIFIIVLCMFTVSIAYHFSDDVVTDNYYKDGLMINRSLQQDERALALGLTASVRFDAVAHEVLVSINGAESLPKQLLLFLDNPVKKNSDQHILLQEISRGHYHAELPTLPQYSWYLALVPESTVEKRKEAEWLLSGEINFSKTMEAHLQPRKQ